MTWRYVITDTVTYWPIYGLRGRDEDTITNYTILVRTHILPSLGKRKLPGFSAEDVDKWLTAESRKCSTRACMPSMCAMPDVRFVQPVACPCGPQVVPGSCYKQTSVSFAPRQPRDREKWILWR